MKWYYERGAGQEGPVSLSVLQAMLASGDLDPTHKVWSKELADWTPAGEVEALNAATEPEPEEPSGPSELEAAMAKLAAVSDDPDLAAAYGDDSTAGAVGGDHAAAQFDVRLISVGKAQIQVIKVIRELTGFGLKEAKELTDNVPATLIEAISSRDAGLVRARITAAGGVVETTQAVLPRAEGPRSLAPTARDHQKDEPPTPVEMPHIASEDLTDEEAELLGDFVQYRLSIGQDVDEISEEIASATPLSEAGAFGFASAVEIDLEHEEGEGEDDEEIGCLGWLGILWVCGMVISGCIRMCSG